MANIEHFQLLEQGPDAWNNWRRQGNNVTIPMDLTGADLSNLDLSSYEFYTTDFTGANLSDTSLGNNFSRSIFKGVDLSKTSFWAPNFSDANLSGAILSGRGFHRAFFTGANLSNATFTGARFDNVNLEGADLTNAILTDIKICKYGLTLPKKLAGANFNNVNLNGLNFVGAELEGAYFISARLIEADFSGANLTGANFSGNVLIGANFTDATLVNANFRGTRYGTESAEQNLGYNKFGLLRPDKYYAHHYLPSPTLLGANFTNATLHNVNFTGVNLNEAIFSNADLTGANLRYASLVRVDVENAIINNCCVYGLSAWSLKGTPSQQRDLIITADNKVEITVDNLQLAQFLYLVIDNRNFREIIDTVTRKIVLILGRFTPDRKVVLDTLRTELRKHNYLSVLFDFDGPVSKNISDTISTIAHLSRFIIVDISDPKSVPQELVLVARLLNNVPIQPIIEKKQREYGMFDDFLDCSSVLELFRYEDLDDITKSLPDKIIAPAETKVSQIVAKRAARKDN
jgi:uncharacterized protein YjbI with pentapeptide repeats